MNNNPKISSYMCATSCKFKLHNWSSNTVVWDVLVYSCRGSKIFPTFVGFLKSKDPADGKEQALLSELNAFNDYIKENVSHILYNIFYDVSNWTVGYLDVFMQFQAPYKI